LSVIFTSVDFIPMGECIGHWFDVYNGEYLDYKV